MHKFLGRLTLEQALRAQDAELDRVLAGQSPGCILGFETENTVSLGRRGHAQDLLRASEFWCERGFSLQEVDRGGQVTIHNPGQLVIFPVVPIAPSSPREFICRLSDTTRALARELGAELKWRDEAPGLYSLQGKVVSLGLRFKKGVATHGLAMNVHNDLEPFSWIVPCGATGSIADRLKTDKPLPEIFDIWVKLLEF